ARIAVRQHLTHTDDGFQTGSQRGASLLFDGFIRLAEKLPALGMADNRMATAGVAQHSHGNGTSEGALLFPVNILSRDLDASAFCHVDGRGQRRVRRRYDDAAMLDVLNLG